MVLRRHSPTQQVRLVSVVITYKPGRHGERQIDGVLWEDFERFSSVLNASPYSGELEPLAEVLGHRRAKTGQTFTLVEYGVAKGNKKGPATLTRVRNHVLQLADIEYATAAARITHKVIK